MSLKWKIYRKEDIEKVLTAILSDYVVSELAGLEQKKAEDIEEHGYPQRNTDYQLDALDSFFEQDLADLFKVREVWAWFENELNYELSNINVTQKGVEALGESDRLESEKTIGEIRKEIAEEVERFYKERLNSEWKGLTVEEATKKLLKGITYVALLGEDGKLTREPFPAISTIKHPNVQITAEIEIDRAGFRISRWLHVNFSESVPHRGISEVMRISGHQHLATGEDVKTAIITP